MDLDQIIKDILTVYELRPEKNKGIRYVSLTSTVNNQSPTLLHVLLFPCTRIIKVQCCIFIKHLFCFFFKTYLSYLPTDSEDFDMKYFYFVHEINL